MCATDMHWSNKRQLACLLALSKSGKLSQHQLSHDDSTTEIVPASSSASSSPYWHTQIVKKNYLIIFA